MATIWRRWGIMGQYWLVLDGTGSVWDGNGWHLVELGQYGAVVAGTWWYWVSITRYYLILSGIGSVKCFYACVY